MGASHGANLDSLLQGYGPVSGRDSDEDVTSRTRPPLASNKNTVTSRPSAAPLADGQDILQFSAPMYYVEEEEGKIVIDVMRLGSMKGEISVDFETKDASGKAGERFEYTCGKVVFKDGEYSKPVEVKLIESDLWCTTLEFKVQLMNPRYCQTGRYLHTCRIKVIDGDCFPSNRFKEEIQQGDDAVTEINGFSLFWEYCKLNFQQGGLGWRTVTVLVLDQLENIYRFIVLALGVYIVDTLFSKKDGSFAVPEEELLLPSREQTATLVGALYIVPMAILHVWDIVRIKLNVLGLSYTFLQTNLVRKYLNFTEKSRFAIPPGEIQDAILSAALDVASAYAALLNLIRLCGKLIILTWFSLMQNPGSWYYILLMPSLMAIYGYCRSATLQEAHDQAGSKYSALLELTQEVCNKDKYRLFANYFQRPRMCDVFATRAQANVEVQIPFEIVRKNNEYFTKWLGPLFIGLYISFEAPQVIKDELSLGRFLAAVGIFSQVSQDFGAGYQEVMRILQTFMPLKQLTILFGMETDVLTWKRVNRARRAETTEVRKALLDKRQQNPEAQATKFISDLIELSLKDVVYEAPSGEKMSAKVNFTVPQGNIIAIKGNHGSGKSTLMRLIAHEIFPTGGSVFIPTFLRILHVSQEIILLDDTPWQNLVFGIQDAADIDPQRIQHVLGRDGFNAKRILELVNEDLKKCNNQPSKRVIVANGVESDEEDFCCAEEERELLRCFVDEAEEENDAGEKSHSASWQNTLSYTEKVKLHLARAFLVNAEVMVLQRPLHHFDYNAAKDILALFRQHVANRGFGMPTASASSRRPRTIFMTTESQEQDSLADIVSDISTGEVIRNPEEQIAAAMKTLGKNHDAGASAKEENSRNPEVTQTSTASRSPLQSRGGSPTKGPGATLKPNVIDHYVRGNRLLGLNGDSNGTNALSRSPSQVLLQNNGSPVFPIPPLLSHGWQAHTGSGIYTASGNVSGNLKR